MADDRLSPEVQQKIQTLQGLGAQLQQIGSQRQQMELMKSESARAKKALEALPEDAPVYRSVGSLMVGDTRTDALARLGDEAETMEIRLKRLKEQEDALEGQFNQLQTELQKALGA